MLQGKYDIAEFSMSAFLMAIDRKWPIIGIPVFPRRLFSSGLIFVRGDSPLSKPSELKGERVAVRSLLSLLAKGDLKIRIRYALGGDPLADRGRGEDRLRETAGA